MTLGLLALACVGVWHISLLWLYRDAPSVLAVWLVAVFLLVLVARRVARRVAPVVRGWLMRCTAHLDTVGIVFVAFLLLLLFHVGFQRAASDGRSYFVQVRSLVMDGDLDFTNDEAGLWWTWCTTVRVRRPAAVEPVLHRRPRLGHRVEHARRRPAR